MFYVDLGTDSQSSVCVRQTLIKCDKPPTYLCLLMVWLWSILVSLWVFVTCGSLRQKFFIFYLLSNLRSSDSTSAHNYFSGTLKLVQLMVSHRLFNLYFSSVNWFLYFDIYPPTLIPPRSPILSLPTHATLCLCLVPPSPPAPFPLLQLGPVSVGQLLLDVECGLHQ